MCDTWYVWFCCGCLVSGGALAELVEGSFCGVVSGKDGWNWWVWMNGLRQSFGERWVVGFLLAWEM